MKNITEKFDGHTVKLPTGKYKTRLAYNKRYYCLMCGTTTDLIETQNDAGKIEYYCPVCIDK